MKAANAIKVRAIKVLNYPSVAKLQVSLKLSSADQRMVKD